MNLFPIPSNMYSLIGRKKKFKSNFIVTHDKKIDLSFEIWDSRNKIGILRLVSS